MQQTKKAVYLEPAPAKINLFLDVLHKRTDGYHELQTVFQALDLMDHLTFEIVVESEQSEQIDFEILIDSNNEVIKNLGPNNLIAKAIEMYFSNLNDYVIAKISSVQLNIFIDKNIPMEAGLGGGSADAAATLRVLNKFFFENYGFSMSEKVLANIALDIGSDVPFCLTSNLRPRVYAESRGEKIFADEEPKNLKILDFNFDKYSNVIVVHPNFGISTQEAYGLFDFSKKEKTICDGFFNAFESVIFKSYPQLLNIKKDLLEIGCDYALLSGSGSTMLGFIKDGENVDEIFNKAEAKFKGVNLFKSRFL